MEVAKRAEACFVKRNGRIYLRLYYPHYDKITWHTSKGQGKQEAFERLDPASSQVLEDEYKEMPASVR